MSERIAKKARQYARRNARSNADRKTRWPIAGWVADIREQAGEVRRKSPAKHGA